MHRLLGGRPRKAFRIRGLSGFRNLSIKGHKCAFQCIKQTKSSSTLVEGGEATKGAGQGGEDLGMPTSFTYPTLETSALVQGLKRRGDLPKVTFINSKTPTSRNT